MVQAIRIDLIMKTSSGGVMSSSPSVPKSVTQKRRLSCDWESSWQSETVANEINNAIVRLQQIRIQDWLVCKELIGHFHDKIRLNGLANFGGLFNTHKQRQSRDTPECRMGLTQENNHSFRLHYLKGFAILHLFIENKTLEEQQLIINIQPLSGSHYKNFEWPLP